MYRGHARREARGDEESERGEAGTGERERRRHERERGDGTGERGDGTGERGDEEIRTERAAPDRMNLPVTFCAMLSCSSPTADTAPRFRV
jgi:hypothetical protein